ncbi:MAG: hypothetical protein KatS3mg027_2188 [Bacteroidia bacterium]|nr:MAG: hypothetical protein KatS3mg027_2188 [Bacteroidia bacterium]
MMQTVYENKQPNWIALAGSVLSLVLVILLLYFIKLITPIPPFPEIASGGGMEVNYGIYNEGTGTIEQNNLGEATNVVVNEQVAANTESTNEPVYTSDNGEIVPLNEKNNKIEVKENTTIIHPTEVKEPPKEKTLAEKLAEKFKQQKGSGGGDGNSGNAGNEGEPDGNPFTHGKGGTGSNPDNVGFGSGKGSGNAPFGFDLKGRSLLSHPPLPSDTKEEGVVVVDIKVDKEGNVIEADPNGRGTTTTSPILKAKARQFAVKLKFSPNSQFEEQKGSITIVFSFK